MNKRQLSKRLEGLGHKEEREPIAVRLDDGTWRLTRSESLFLTSKGLDDYEAQTGQPVRRLNLKAMRMEELQAVYREVVGV